jgi:diguanylate cyclase (GGDEF)-like protein/PAS domain S-box-containing protein
MKKVREDPKEEIRKIRSRYKTIMNNTETAIVIWNEDYQVVDWNRYAEELFGWEKKEILNKNLISLLITKQDQPIIKLLLDKSFNNFKTRSINKVKTKKEGTVFCEVSNIPELDSKGEVIEIISIIKDLSSPTSSDHNLIYYDSVTGIYNRKYYEEELKRLDTARQLPLSIIVGDVNRLKLTNDIFGHHQGDDLLKEIAGIIDYCTRSEDVIARWGGDEFGILLPQTNLAATKKVVARIKDACQQSDFKPILPNIALGLATKEQADTNVKEVFNEAEAKMYQDKESEKIASEDRVLSNLLEYLEGKLEGKVNYKEQVIDLTEKMGDELGLDEYELEKIFLLAKYHDIGKVGVAKEILNKDKQLTTQEWEQYLNHLQLGYDIARSFSTLTPIADEILYHHEAWNGTGYPNQLHGEEIPFLSRIIYIVSYYYELITNVDCRTKLGINCDRDYSQKRALQKIDSYAGSLFDPELVEVFLNIFDY